MIVFSLLISHTKRYYSQRYQSNKEQATNSNLFRRFKLSSSRKGRRNLGYLNAEETEITKSFHIEDKEQVNYNNIINP